MTALEFLDVRGSLKVAHTWSYGDDMTTWAFEKDNPEDRPWHADLRCPGCTSRGFLSYPSGDATLLVFEHEAGCGWLAGRLREAGPEW